MSSVLFYLSYQSAHRGAVNVSTSATITATLVVASDLIANGNNLMENHLKWVCLSVWPSGQQAVNNFDTIWTRQRILLSMLLWLALNHQTYISHSSTEHLSKLAKQKSPQFPVPHPLPHPDPQSRVERQLRPKMIYEHNFDNHFLVKQLLNSSPKKKKGNKIHFKVNFHWTNTHRMSRYTHICILYRLCWGKGYNK